MVILYNANSWSLIQMGEAQVFFQVLILSLTQPQLFNTVNESSPTPSWKKSAQLFLWALLVGHWLVKSEHHYTRLTQRHITACATHAVTLFICRRHGDFVINLKGFRQSCGCVEAEKGVRKVSSVHLSVKLWRLTATFPEQLSGIFARDFTLTFTQTARGTAAFNKKYLPLLPQMIHVSETSHEQRSW